MKEYISQFGDVTRLRLARNKKVGCGTSMRSSVDTRPAHQSTTPTLR